MFHFLYEHCILIGVGVIVWLFIGFLLMLANKRQQEVLAMIGYNYPSVVTCLELLFLCFWPLQVKPVSYLVPSVAAALQWIADRDQLRRYKRWKAQCRYRKQQRAQRQAKKRAVDIHRKSINEFIDSL